MPKFMVNVIKTETYSTMIEIKASSMEEAEKLAEEAAQERPMDWSYEETEWSSWAEVSYEKA